MSFDQAAQLTCSTLLSVAANFGLSVPAAVRRHKAVVVDFLRSQRNAAIGVEIERLVSEKETDTSADVEGGDDIQRVRPRLSDFEIGKSRVDYDYSHFLDLPDPAIVDACYRCFYEATCNAAVKMSICAVCAQEVDLGDDEMRCCLLKDIPNVHRLIPMNPHPAHDHFEGKLLEPNGVQIKNGSYRVNICSECVVSLQKKTPDLPPRRQ